MKLHPEYQVKPAATPRIKRQVPHACPGDKPVVAILPTGYIGPAPEMIYCDALQRVVAVIVPKVLRADLLERCIKIGGIGTWKSQSHLAKSWGVWCVIGDDRWAEAQAVLDGARPRGWKFQFLN
ncbi:MAG: hypothetical protein J0L84_02115 [Verrucomicrobia bacterium]|nr:hypothetical protein [Verrucomicrobiota bacterium]